MLLYLIVGTAIGATIYGYIPQEWIASLAGPENRFAIPLAALAGVPLYIRAESAIPIGLALVRKGMSLGAVIALLIGGAGMAIPEMSMLLSIFKARIVAAIVAMILFTAGIGGFLFDFPPQFHEFRGEHHLFVKADYYIMRRISNRGFAVCRRDDLLESLTGCLIFLGQIKGSIF